MPRIVAIPVRVEHESDVPTWISKRLDTLREEHRARHLYASPIYTATGIMSYCWARYVWCIHDNPPYHNAQRIVIHNIHSYWGGAHPGGAAIESILRVRLCRGPASRREPESHGTLKCMSAQGSQDARQTLLVRTFWYSQSVSQCGAVEQRGAPPPRGT